MIVEYAGGSEETRYVLLGLRVDGQCAGSMLAPGSRTVICMFEAVQRQP